MDGVQGYERALAAAAPGLTSEQRWFWSRTRPTSLAPSRHWTGHGRARCLRVGSGRAAGLPSWPDVDACLVALATLSILTQALNCRPCSHLQPHRPELRKP